MTPERRAGLVFLPIASTVSFYWLPDSLQSLLPVQFLPQLIAYLALGFWAYHNARPLNLLGLSSRHIHTGLLWGLCIGALLGLLNSVIILYGLPRLGIDILFLQHTPHARMPTFLMIPWFIVGIAVFVEVNFRGFHLGRLLAYFSQFPALHRAAPTLAILCSAFLFCFDPFMVNTFRDLHWMALMGWNPLGSGVGADEESLDHDHRSCARGGDHVQHLNDDLFVSRRVP